MGTIKEWAEGCTVGKVRVKCDIEFEQVGQDSILSD